MRIRNAQDALLSIYLLHTFRRSELISQERMDIWNENYFPSCSYDSISFIPEGKYFFLSLSENYLLIKNASTAGSS